MADDNEHQEIEKQYREMLRDFARMVDGLFNPGYVSGEKARETGFIVFCFALGDAPGRRTNYISNVDRTDAIAALKEWIARAEGMHHEAPPRKQ